MVFKEFGKDIINLSKNYKTLNVVTSEQVNSLGLLTNNLNSLKDIGNLTTDSMNGLYKSVQSFGNDNLTYYFQSVAEGAENARVNIVDAYAAILDGNTHGLKNVQSIMNTFNNSFDGSVEKQKEFTKAVGQSNKGLANYLNSIEAGGTATLKGYAGQLVKTTAKTVGLQIATTALQAAISLGLSLAINALIAGISKAINKQKELRQGALDSAQSLNEQSKAMDDLVSQYEAILDSEKTEAEKIEELNEWKQTLADTYGITKDKLADLNLEREDGIKLLQEEIKYAKIKQQLDWQESNKKAISNAKNKIEHAPSFNQDGNVYGDGVDYWTGIDYSISDEIKNLFDEVVQVDEFTVDFKINTDNAIDEYERLQSILTEIDKISIQRDLTESEQLLYNDIKTQIAYLETLKDDMEIYKQNISSEAMIKFEGYKLADDSYKNLGKDSYLAWRDGLLATADGDKELEKELLALAEKQFPDYAKYFNNLDKAKSKFITRGMNSKEGQYVSDFLESLTSDELEIATQIPDLFADGLDGATAKIEAWKADPKNKIAPEVDTSELNTIIETTSKKVKLITTAMEEMNDTGYISSSTYAEIVEMGGNFADCLEVQNGKLKLNVEKLKELETQELETAKSATELAIAELQANASINSASDYKVFEEKMSNLLKQKGIYQTIIDEINNAKPNESGSGSSSSSSDPWKEQFDKEYSEKQHLLAMEQLSEEEYLDWLDEAYKKYFSDLTKYQDEYYKYEEEVYKGRKQLAEDYFDEEQKLFEDRVSNLEDYLEKFKDGKVTTFVEQSDIDALDELNKQMKELYEVGNVDLTKRPKVSAETMRKAGYDVADGSTATVYSTMEFLWQDDEENGKYVTVHYTPILPDGTVLDEKTLHDYIYGTLAGSQDILNADAENLGIVLKVDTDFNISEEDMKSLETGNYTDNIQNIIKACDDWSVSLHDIQAEWMVLDEKVKNIQPLTIEEKYDYISSAYQEIINEINARIGEILDAGIEGHEEEVAKLEKQIEEYQEKLAEVPKDAAKEEQDYIKKLKEDYSDLYDENIDKIKKQQKASEKAAQAEIDAVQEKIDALKEANEKAEEANDIEKARQDLANASQRTRQVYGADGSISYQVDQEKVNEAQEKLDKLLLEQQVNLLEEQKKLLEEAKDKQSKTYDDLIADYENEKKKKVERFNTLIKKLDEYLNPNQSESNSDVWKAIAKLEGGKYENGIYTDKDGNVIDIDELVKSAGSKTDDKKPETTTDTKTDNSKSETKDNGTTTLSMERKSYSPDKIENEVKDKTESAIDGLFRKLEQNFGLKSGSLNLEKAYQIYSNSPMMNFDPYGAMKERSGLANKEYVSNVNNNNNAANVTVGDIVINNPVGNSDDLAKELALNIPIAFQKQMYSNLK